eukprot:CAMPEP_0195001118 /NCGR_PEP_ID=MMETSP0326_2-20130528/1009_1 /TAXON_ID=2866 ORGANISM="Crypthecodinium cohnii, Strain Seligo" /NCGR_SAMPLE_ID=MMETSP0326_2 /ASSEMBLY_ACC=CAM_ASM_000348 /LENGTH=81 /DNA_ID=CAMNT_0040003281 /DNA_START=140 /DNA_END=381 /DNA_ORIENTATION=+
MSQDDRIDPGLLNSPDFARLFDQRRSSFSRIDPPISRSANRLLHAANCEIRLANRDEARFACSTSKSLNTTMTTMTTTTTT